MIEKVSKYKYCAILYLFSDVQVDSLAVLAAVWSGSQQSRPGGQHSAELLHCSGEKGLGGQANPERGGCGTVSEI